MGILTFHQNTLGTEGRILIGQVFLSTGFLHPGFTVLEVLLQGMIPFLSFKRYKLWFKHKIWVKETELKREPKLGYVVHNRG